MPADYRSSDFATIMMIGVQPYWRRRANPRVVKAITMDVEQTAGHAGQADRRRGPRLNRPTPFFPGKSRLCAPPDAPLAIGRAAWRAPSSDAARDGSRQNRAAMSRFRHPAIGAREPKPARQGLGQRAARRG